MRKCKKTRLNKGFTLIELMVTLLISVILMATVSSVFLMSQKVYSRGANISYKEGTVTNTETNLQNLLAVATKVTIANAPKIDDAESYSIGFDENGQCQEFRTTLGFDGSGAKQFTKTITTVPHLSEIEVKAVNNNITTLNYKLIPADDTMSTLRGGVVMNNINATNNNQPTQAQLISGTKLLSGTEMRYLVLTFEEVKSSPVITGGINNILKESGVIPGNWDNMIIFARSTADGGYKFEDKGSVYTDSTGTYVTAKAMYIGSDFVGHTPGTPTAKDYLEYLNSKYGDNNTYFSRISETTRIITEADYETDTTKSGCVWQADRYPRLGDLYLYQGSYYIWETKESNVYSIKEATEGHGWLKLVSSPVQFQ